MSLSLAGVIHDSKQIYQPKVSHLSISRILQSTCIDRRAGRLKDKCHMHRLISVGEDGANLKKVDIYTVSLDDKLIFVISPSRLLMDGFIFWQSNDEDEDEDEDDDVDCCEK